MLSILGKDYYTRDHEASVRELCSSSGTIVARYSYDPYGRMTLVSGSNLATMQYTGDYYHATSGLNLTKYRAFDANTGRWLSRDPLPDAERSEGPNLYKYVKNNPISETDPLGLCDCSAAKLAVSMAQADLSNAQGTYQNDVTAVNNDAARGQGDVGWTEGSLSFMIVSGLSTPITNVAGGVGAIGGGLASAQNAWNVAQDYTQYTTDQAKIPGDQQAVQTAQQNLAQAQANLAACQAGGG